MVENQFEPADFVALNGKVDFLPNHRFRGMVIKQFQDGLVDVHWHDEMAHLFLPNPIAPERIRKVTGLDY